MMMRFKVDENLPSETALLLKQAGYDAVTVLEQRMQGVHDAVLIEVCRKEKRILITLDLDFANIKMYPPKEYAGIIIVKLRTQSKHSVLRCVNSILPLFGSESIHESLWIVDESHVRIHNSEDA